MNNRKMKGQGGFTLIEIIAVLIILGILAAVATPKFMSMQKEARIAAIKGLKASMQSTAVMVYAKASLTGENPLTVAKVPDLKGPVNVTNGYPTSLADLLNAMDYDGFKKKGTDSLQIPGYENCWVKYVPAGASGAMPIFPLNGTSEDTGGGDDGQAATGDGC